MPSTVRRSSLSPNAIQVVRYVCEHSEHGCAETEEYETVAVQHALELSPEAAGVALEELARNRLIQTGSDHGHAGTQTFLADWNLFFAQDPELKGWSASADSHQLMNAILKHRGEAVSCEDLAAQLGWPPRRFNPACAWLELSGRIECGPGISSYPWFRHWVRAA
jgi:hypothetical protein